MDGPQSSGIYLLSALQTLCENREVGRVVTALFIFCELPGHINIADALSRFTKIEQAQTRTLAEEYIRFVAHTAAPQTMTTEEIEDRLALDQELEYVRQSIETGNWENSNSANYKPIRDELCLFGTIVLRGSRIVLPKKLRARVIELGHEGHQGMALAYKGLVARHRQRS